MHCRPETAVGPLQPHSLSHWQAGGVGESAQKDQTLDNNIRANEWMPPSLS